MTKQQKQYLKYVPKDPTDIECVDANPELYRVAVDLLRDDPNIGLLRYWSEAEVVHYIDEKIG